MQNIDIKQWFPRSIFQAENILNPSELQLMHKFLMPWLDNYSRRNGMLNVDSTHSTQNFVGFDEISIFESKIYEAVNTYARALGFSKEQIKTLKISNIWANRSYKSDFNFPHVHSGSQFSGVYYLQAPAECAITFYNNITKSLVEPDNFNYLSYQYVKYACISNSLLLFESDLLHGNEYQPPGEKIAISFNIGFF